MVSAYRLISSALESQKNPQKITVFKRFFKTGPGQYGEGDQFLGLTVPQIHTVEAKYWQLATLADLEKLLNHPTHEYRTVALAMLNRQFAKADGLTQKKFFDFYLAHTSRINNWDLVDISAPKIVGAYLLDKPRTVLYRLAASGLIWERRISIVSTYTFIRLGEFTDTLEISKLLFTDTQDLIHKAVGWMLREVGKRDLRVLTDFLDVYTLSLPRTTLRYAIEKFPPTIRRHYLKIC